MTVISVVNQKGGVGKTTITFNLAKSLARDRKRILVLDNDPQGNLTASFLDDPHSFTADMLNVYERQWDKIIPQTVTKNIDMVGSNISLAKIAESGFDTVFELKEWIDKNKKNYDFILIDCLPSFGYLNMAALNASNKVLIPTQPSPYAFQGVKDLMDSIEKVRNRLNPSLGVLGLILNKVEGRQTQIARDLEAVLRDKYNKLVFNSVIPKAVKMEESPSFSQSINEYDPKSKVAEQFNLFYREFKKRVEQ